MSDHDDTLLREVRIRASLLMKALRKDDPAALARVHRLLWSRKSPDELPVSGLDVKRRTALEAVAREFGYGSYAALHRDRNAPTAATGVDTTLFFQRGQHAFWNNWYSRYADASAHVVTAGGFLFPYRNQFVVVEADFLTGLGVDATNADWAAIGFDWAQPKDMAAYSRLSRELCALGYGAKAVSAVEA